VSRPAQSNKAARDRAFELVALPWIEAVYQLALSLAGDEARAAEIVEDTFLRAYGSWSAYMPGHDCRRWLLAVCLDVFMHGRHAPSPPPATPETGDGVVRDATDASSAPMEWNAAFWRREPIES